MQMKLSTLDQVRDASADLLKAINIAELAESFSGKLVVRLIDTTPRNSILRDAKEHEIRNTELLNRIREVIAEHYHADADLHRGILSHLGVDTEA